MSLAMDGHGMKAVLARLIAGRSLSEDEAAHALALIMAGEASDAQIGGFLTALRLKGETVDEIVGAARTMRARAVRIAVAADVVLDTCGTGGDGANTFNISTAVAFVCAAAGVTVAKHGNRAVSSRVGSADVLEALGVRIDLGPEAVARCITEVGLGFMFAPVHHAALRHAAPARRELGFRTMLNLLGPMTNPASASHQLIGIYDASRLVTVAEVLGRLGSRRAMVVAGEDGLDEVSIGAATRAAVLDAGVVSRARLAPEDFGLARAPLAAIAGGERDANAALVRGVLRGEIDGPPRDVVQLNAGCALWVAERAPDLAGGVALAGELLASGAGHLRLEALVALSQELAP